jgi:hypothetical protein
VVAAAVAALVTASSAARADVDWGADAFSAPKGAVERAEIAMGTSFESYAIYSNIDRAHTMQSKKVAKAIDEGALVYLNINSSIWGAGGREVPICWNKVAEGHRDGQLREWVHAILATHYSSFILTFDHEATVRGPSQPKCALRWDNARTYRAAFHHVRTLFRRNGVGFPWAYVMVAGATNWPSGLQYRPPPRNYEIIGTDQYYHCNDRYQSPPDAFASFFAWTAKYAPNKPVLVGEIGANSTCPDQSLVWLLAAQARLLAHDVVAINWNLRTDGGKEYNPLLQPDIRAWWLAWATQETG